MLWLPKSPKNIVRVPRWNRRILFMGKGTKLRLHKIDPKQEYPPPDKLPLKVRKTGQWPREFNCGGKFHAWRYSLLRSPSLSKQWNVLIISTRSSINTVQPLFRGNTRDQLKCPLNGGWAGVCWWLTNKWNTFLLFCRGICYSHYFKSTLGNV